MIATTTPVALLPPPMEIFFGSSSTSSASEATLPECVANLMPFNIDYDGPAPIDSFLVLRTAPPSDNEKEERSQSYISAFRGRAIQSTPLPLPAGYTAKLITVSQVAPEASTSSASRSSNEVVAAIAEKFEAKEREAKRQRLAKPPQRQQRFSMDSDDDEGNGEEEDGFSQEASPEPYQPSAPLSPDIEATEVSGAEGKQAKGEGPKIRISPLAEVSGDELRIWGADGPIDKGDDTFVRTIAEWYSVVSPLVSSMTLLRCTKAL